MSEIEEELMIINFKQHRSDRAKENLTNKQAEKKL